MLRQIYLVIAALLLATTPAAAQKRIDIPGLGSIYIGGGPQSQTLAPDRIDRSFKVLDRKRNYNDEPRVVFDVSRNQGRFSQLRLGAIGKVVRITGMEVVFGNGKSQKIDIYEPIYPGNVSPAFDLTGKARGIRRVIITKRRTWQRERGEIELLGRPDVTDRYELIGDEQFRTNNRRIVLRLGRNKGVFDAIRFRALGAPLRVSTIDITFGNGSTQAIRYFKTLSPGEFSETFGLKGKSRGIRTVVVNTRFSWFDGGGRLQLYALRSKKRRPQPASYEAISTKRTGRGSQDIVFNSIPRGEHWNFVRLKALDRPIEIDDVILTFGNGERQRVDVDERLAPNELTKPIALKGRAARRIRSVRVDVNRRQGRRGRLQLLGLKDIGSPRSDRRVQQQVPKGWVLFGSETVAHRENRQVIDIGREQGMFDRIAFRAVRNDVSIRDVTVIYGNGNRDRHKLDLDIPAGYGTPPLDLKARRGKGRFIKSIIITHDRDRKYRRQPALLEVYGDYSDDWLDRDRRADRGDNWILLGAHKAAMFSKDNDAFPVGKRYGRFSAVRVRVKRRDVKVYGMRVTYENGSTETVPIYGKLKPGQTSQPFDLKGRRRFIRQVDLRYRTSFNFGGDGIVEVWGRR